MDFKQRLLLRRFLSTRDPFDAVAFAASTHRSGESLDVKVWVVQYLPLDCGGGDDVTLHSSREKAYEYAAYLASRQIDHSLSVLTWDEVYEDEDELEATEDWMIEAHEAWLQKSYEEVVNIFEDNCQDGYAIRVYEETVR